MTTILKKNKSTDSLIADYMDSITTNCESKMPIIKNHLKIKDDNFIIPTLKTYDDIIKYNFNNSQLKLIAKHYKLKLSGNKPQLVTRIYSYLYFSSYLIKIQKVFRGILTRKYIFLHGPAAINRKLCTNTDDFITMEPIKEICFHQFLSYKDIDGFIYGFDIISLYNLFLKSKDAESIRNPYNRNIIPESEIKKIKSLLRIGKLLKVNINLQYEDDTQNVSSEKAIELRALALFQNIDSLGNYSNSQWFLSLTRNQLVKFVRELCDIWNYRAQLSNETKRQICPPIGDPFRNLSMPYIYNEPNMWNVRKVILEVLEKFVNSGIDNDSKTLGACYILGALTLVNESAAIALPWLFHSFGQF